MKHILIMLFTTSLLVGESRLPKPKIGKKFNLSYSELTNLHEVNTEGNIVCEFIINKEGNVIDPKIVQTFAPEYNEIILRKISKTKYRPALQNGKPVPVKYLLPIQIQKN